MSATTPAPRSPRRAGGGGAGASARLGLGLHALYSAAGHDAQNLASVTESGMLFIPSRAARATASTRPATPAAIERGANVLLHTLLDSRRADPPDPMSCRPALARRTSARYRHAREPSAK